MGMAVHGMQEWGGGDSTGEGSSGGRGREKVAVGRECTGV